MEDQEAVKGEEQPDETIPDADFESALAEVLQLHGAAFKELADYDAGRV